MERIGTPQSAQPKHSVWYLLSSALTDFVVIGLLHVAQVDRELLETEVGGENGVLCIIAFVDFDDGVRLPAVLLSVGGC